MCYLDVIYSITKNFNSTSLNRLFLRPEYIPKPVEINIILF